jgi:hypothetical protein
LHRTHRSWLDEQCLSIQPRWHQWPADGSAHQCIGDALQLVADVVRAAACSATAVVKVIVVGSLMTDARYSRIIVGSS